MLGFARQADQSRTETYDLLPLFFDQGVGLPRSGDIDSIRISNFSGLFAAFARRQ